MVLDFGGENQMRIKELLILVIKKSLQESVVFMKELVVYKKVGYLIPFQSFD